MELPVGLRPIVGEDAEGKPPRHHHVKPTQFYPQDTGQSAALWSFTCAKGGGLVELISSEARQPCRGACIQQKLL